MSAECHKCGADLVGWGEDMHCARCDAVARYQALRNAVQEEETRLREEADGWMRSAGGEPSNEMRKQMALYTAYNRAADRLATILGEGGKRCERCGGTGVSEYLRCPDCKEGEGS